MIESERLFIRALNDEDYKILYPLHSDIEVMKFIREPDSSLKQTKSRMNEMLSYGKLKPGFGLFPAFIKKTNECIGWVLLINAELDLEKDIEVGYRLFPRFWGKGYATELTKKMIEYGKSLKLDKICAVTRPDNTASRRVLEKAGLEYMNEREFYNLICSYYEIKI